MNILLYDNKLNHVKKKYVSCNLKLPLKQNKLFIFVFDSLSWCDKYNSYIECYSKVKIPLFTNQNVKWWFVNVKFKDHC